MKIAKNIFFFFLLRVMKLQNVYDTLRTIIRMRRMTARKRSLISAIVFQREVKNYFNFKINRFLRRHISRLAHMFAVLECMCVEW